MTDHQSRLQQIRERVEKATEGPWETMPNIQTNVWKTRRENDPHHIIVPWDEDGDIPTSADGEFIAASREDVPFLLGLVEELLNEKDLYPAKALLFDSMKAERDEVEEQRDKLARGLLELNEQRSRYIALREPFMILGELMDAIRLATEILEEKGRHP